MSAAETDPAEVGRAISDRLLAQARASGDRWPQSLAEPRTNGHYPPGRALCPPGSDAAPGAQLGAAVVLIRLADVLAQRLEWLWPGRLPAGKLVTLDGDPSLGKSTLAITMAAHVSTGAPWPDGAPCPTGDVVVLSAEDGLADTIRPRLDAAGGDPARVHALTAVRDVDDDGAVIDRPVTLADITAIRHTLERTGARLLVVDVLMAYLPSRVDSHRDQDVRGVLHRLAEIADATGCTVLLLRHLNKTPGMGSPLYRGGGSIGIIGAARAGYVVALDPDDDQVRVLACTKCNLAPMPPSLGYRLVSAPGSHVARVQWTGESVHAAADLLRPDANEATGDDRRELDRWLLDFLGERDGGAPAKEVYREGRAVGYSNDQLKRAKVRLRVTATKTGMTGGWRWELHNPEERTEAREERGSQNPPPSRPSPLPSTGTDDA